MKGVVFFLCLASPFSFSHKVISMVYAMGLTVEGQVGFSNGELAPKGTPVEVFFNEKNIATTEIGDDGVFVYTVEKPADYTFVADMGAGHVANMMINAEELGALESSVDQSGGVIVSTVGLTASDIERAVAKQIKPLRQDIQSLKEKRRWMDVIGGIGFIIGIFGCYAWIRSMRAYRASTHKF